MSSTPEPWKSSAPDSRSIRRFVGSVLNNVLTKAWERRWSKAWDGYTHGRRSFVVEVVGIDDRKDAGIVGLR